MGQTVRRASGRGRPTDGGGAALATRACASACPSSKRRSPPASTRLPTLRTSAIPPTSRGSTPRSRPPSITGSRCSRSASGRAPAVPAVLTAQARLDARDGVSLDTVLRRYFAGTAVFGDFLAEEAERAGVPNSDLRRLLGGQATLGDRLLAAVSAEHASEAQSRPRTAAELRRECVKRLLAGSSSITPSSNTTSRHTTSA